MSDASALSTQLEHLLEAAPGVVAVAARDLPTGRRIDLRAGERFPSASVIKIAILVELFAQADERRVDLDAVVSLRSADKIEGSGVLSQLHEGLELTLLDLAHLMITVSDNTASNLLLDRVGCEAVTERMISFGFPGIVMGRKFYDFAARDRGCENWVTAGDLADLLCLMEQRAVVSPAACDQMLTIMLKQQFGGRIPSLLPPDTRVANKTGTISTACHDAGIIYAAHGPMSLAVLTRDIPRLADAEDLIRRVSALVWEHWAC